jgi:hypothetical protein
MFLPRMTWGNWLFWGILVFVGINFLWLGLLEQYIPQWVGALIGLIAFLGLLIYGPREKEASEETEE